MRKSKDWKRGKNTNFEDNKIAYIPPPKSIKYPAPRAD